MTKNTHLINEAKAWVKRKIGTAEVVQIMADLQNSETAASYQLYTAYEKNPDYLGRILFDAEGYWIYDGDVLSIAEQEQLAKFIIHYEEPV